MKDASKRLLLALAGGLVGAALVAFVEARAIARGAGGAATLHGDLGLWDVWAIDLAVLAPLAAAVALGVFAFGYFVEPDEARTFGEIAADARAAPVLERARNAAAAPLFVLAALAWSTATANLAARAFAHGAASAVGVALAAASIGLLVVFLATALALVVPLRRVLVRASRPGERGATPLLDPIFTGGVALVLSVVAFAGGVHAGDTGGGGGGPLGLFGVFKRAELDLRPVVDLLTIVAFAHLVPLGLARARRAPLRLVLAALVVVAAGANAVVQAGAANAHPSAVRAIERGAPLGKIALAVVRRATDRDRDGASPYFAGGDCDDRDPRRSPTAIDVPGNGVDEDCSGADLPLAAPPPPKPAPPAGAAVAAEMTPKIPPDLNLIFVTIDTVRPDVGFMGYPKPVTPNLDALAAKSVVFDRAYAMASYTGKSLGPLMIGKYPSETERDGGHFNTFFPSNTFVAERLKRAGIHTMGVHAHWYFAAWSGLSQGSDVWDLSAKPPENQGDNDTTTTSAALSDAAIRVLSQPKNTASRFYMWIHYMDPHAQYMDHPGAPDFRGGEAGGVAASRAAYDGEIWFTDKHLGRVLDYVASQPWGAKTAIVVTSDHGEAFAEHNMSWHGLEIWEVLLRVPLVVYVPGIAPHHVPVKRSHVDVVPTVLALMGAPVPAAPELSGESMVADLYPKTPDAPAYDERDVYVDMPAGPYTGMRRGVITGPTPGMKLISFGGTQVQLFDLAADPDEKEDLSADDEKRAAALARMQAIRGRLREIEVKPDAPTVP